MNFRAARHGVLVAALLALPSSGRVPAGKPEDAGMSAERLQRIHGAVARHIDAGEIAGAVTLVARHGKIVHFQAHGLMDLEAKRPMTPDAIFRIASITKPITGVAVMMMVEEGKIRLSDPASRFIPEFKDTRVAAARDSITPRPQPSAAESRITIWRRPGARSRSAIC